MPTFWIGATLVATFIRGVFARALLPKPHTVIAGISVQGLWACSDCQATTSAAAARRANPAARTYFGEMRAWSFPAQIAPARDATPSGRSSSPV